MKVGVVTGIIVGVVGLVMYLMLLKYEALQIVFTLLALILAVLLCIGIGLLYSMIDDYLK